jgi:hypothetical protein
MKRLLTGSLLLLVVFLAIPAPLAAQEFRNMELNLFFGATGHSKNLYEIGFPQSPIPIRSEFKLVNSFRGGLRFNLNTTRHWGEEIFFSYEPNSANFIGNTIPPQQNYDIRIFNFGINAMYYLNEEESHRTRPFLSFGLGGTMYQPTAQARQTARDPFRGNLPGFESSAEFALNYGTGFKHALNDRWGFRMDLRGFVARTPTFGLPRSSSNPNVVVFPASGATHNVEVSAGILARLKR